MIGPELLAQISVLTEGERSRVIASVVAPLTRALLAFNAGELGERELLAIELSVNDTLRVIVPAGGYEEMADRTKAAILARVAQLDATEVHA